MRVALMAYNRPDALRRTLESWSKVDRTDVEFYIHIDGPNAELHAIAAEFTPNVITQDRNRGSEMHAWFVFNKSFDEDGVDYCVLAQDDVEVTTDVLDYFRYCDEQFRDHQDVLLASSGGASREHDLSMYYQVDLARTFSSTIWATWPDRWTQWLKDYWWGSARPRTMGADIWIDHRVMPLNHLRATVARWGRGKPFGLGTHITDEALLAAHQPNPWAGDVTPPADVNWFVVENNEDPYHG